MLDPSGYSVSPVARIVGRVGSSTSIAARAASMVSENFQWGVSDRH
jgi:hypothetical protein